MGCFVCGCFCATPWGQYKIPLRGVLGCFVKGPGYFVLGFAKDALGCSILAEGVTKYSTGWVFVMCSFVKLVRGSISFWICFHEIPKRGLFWRVVLGTHVRDVLGDPNILLLPDFVLRPITYLHHRITLIELHVIQKVIFFFLFFVGSLSIWRMEQLVLLLPEWPYWIQQFYHIWYKRRNRWVGDSLG